jgi:pimeloyl-ACP methyl ester carboxylesterase
MSIEFPLSGKGLAAPFGVRVRAPGETKIRFPTQAARRVLVGRSLIGRITRTALAGSVIAVSAVLAVQAVAFASAHPRGLMYDVGGGRRMRLVCEGAASAQPTVVFESGAFGFSGDWVRAQRQLTRQGVRSCAYDRAGMGLSDPSPEPRDGVHVARDLEKLLSVAHVDGTLVLVGHSMAGSRLHLFANRNPDRVKGLVFVDTTPSEAMDEPMVRRYVAGFTAEASAAAGTAPFGILRLLAVTGLGDKVGLPQEEDVEKRWQFGSAAYERTAYLESRDWPVVAAQALRTGAIDPRLPVAVVTAGVTEGVEGPTMKAVQAAPALASEHGYVSVVEGATHNGLLTAQFAPAIVKGIDFVLNAVGDPSRGGSRPSTVFNTQIAALQDHHETLRVR